MIRNRIIVFFFLSLLMLVVGHNSFAHVHHDLAGNVVTENAATTHAHVSHHHDGHHHNDESPIWNWIGGLFTDFAHPDQGAQHQEFLLKPASSAVSIQILGDSSGPLWTALATLSGYRSTQEGLRPQKIMPAQAYFCYAPPDLSSTNYRGPPQFS